MHFGKFSGGRALEHAAGSTSPQADPARAMHETAYRQAVFHATFLFPAKRKALELENSVNVGNTSSTNPSGTRCSQSRYLLYGHVQIPLPEKHA